MDNTPKLPLRKSASALAGNKAVYPINTFTLMDSVYGRLIVPRFDRNQAASLIRDGRPHIDEQVKSTVNLASILPPRCVVVDAGANIGLISIPVAQAIKAKGGTVHAFEVQRQIYYALCGAAVLNGLDNLYPHHLGLGATRTRLLNPTDLIDYARENDFGAYALAENQIGEATIDIVPVDALGLDRLDFLKIDVEGMEIDVLTGAQEMIRAHSPYVWVEFSRDHDGRDDEQEVAASRERERIKAQFEGLDYQFHTVGIGDLLCVSRERAARENLTVISPD